MRRTLTLSLLLLGCCKLVAAQGVPNVGTVSGFKALDIPRRDLPIGAQWLPGIGPAGTGQGDGSLVVRRGLSTSTLTSTQRRQIAAGLAKYFGLTANLSRDVEILYKDLTVITVSDITQLPIKSGQSVLYEGIKASKFELKYKSSLDSTVRAALTAKGIPLEGTAGAGGASSLVVGGEDIFVAYRVVGFESQGVKKQSKRISSGGGGSTARTKLGRYEIGIDSAGIYSCYCPMRTPEKWQSCARSAESEIQVRSYEISSGPSGDIYETTLQYVLEKHKDRPFKLATSEDGSSITTDYLRVQLRYRPTQNMPGFCMIEIDDPYSLLELTTSKFKLRHVNNPVAPGW